MAVLIATIIFFSSLIGMGIIVFPKIPLLVELPKKARGRKKAGFVSVLKKRIGQISFFKNFSYELFLQKLLSKIRILSLRIENRTSDSLQKLREKQKIKKIGESDNYWKNIQKSTKKRKKQKKINH